MKKEIINYFMFVGLMISILLVYIFLLPLKIFDDIFKTSFGNKTIDKILWLAGSSPI